MKRAILILAMVLLSTAAWGETKYSLKELQNLERNLYPKSGVSFTAPDPTAWKQTGNKDRACESLCFSRYKDEVSKKGMVETANWKRFGDCLSKCEENPPKPKFRHSDILDCRLRCANSKGVVNPECESACLGQEPWGDSRYRLEKNEVTGEYRITENKNGEWKEIENDNTWDCPNWRVRLSDCKRKSEERIKNYLERLRKKEREEKAWRPIK